MLSGISIFCFAASYAVALLLEASRLMFRSGIRGAVMLGFGAAGFFAHTLYLGYRAATGAAPLSSEFDWYLVAAWALAAVYLYLTVYFPRTAIGLFVLPLVLALIGAANFLASQTPFARSRASQAWGLLHGTFLLAGTVAVLVGFVAGAMHLLQSYRLKHKLRPAQGLQLPTLERLERVNARAIWISALLLGIGFLSGVVLNLINRSRQVEDALPWTDPVVWSSALLLGWFVVAAVFSVLYKPARQGRKVAYLTVASFLFLALSLGIQLLARTQHGGAAVPDAGARRADAAGRAA